MLTLTKAAVTSRKAIRYGIYGIVALIVLRFAFGLLVDIYKRVFPPQAPPPTVKYGVLPEIPFPNQEKQNLTYELEFLNDVQKFPTQLQVFFIPKPTTNLLALENAQNKASSLGFNREGKELVETIYSFTSPDNLSTLNINIVTGAFSISYDTNSNPNVLDSRAPDFDIATTLVKGKLQSAGLLPQDLADGTPINQYLKKSSVREFVPALSQSESNVTQVNLYRKPYGTNEIPSITQNADRSNAWFVIAAPSTIIAAEYHYFMVDETEFATYPIKTLEEAWQDLLSGNSFVVSRGSNQSDEVLITNAFLAYFDPSQYTEFYQPVIVFENEEGFRALVPAIANEFYGRTSEEPSTSE